MESNVMLHNEIFDCLVETETNISEFRHCQLPRIIELTKNMLNSDDWSDEDMQFLKQVYKMLDAVDLLLHIYQEWIRNTLDADEIQSLDLLRFTATYRNLLPDCHRRSNSKRTDFRHHYQGEAKREMDSSRRFPVEILRKGGLAVVNVCNNGYVAQIFSFSHLYQSLSLSFLTSNCFKKFKTGRAVLHARDTAKNGLKTRFAR